jgi:hypothetical protein
VSDAPTEELQLELEPQRDRLDLTGWAVLVIAGGLALAVNILALGILLDAFQENAQLSDNAAQVLATVFGGMIGILGSSLGFRMVLREREHKEAA